MLNLVSICSVEASLHMREILCYYEFSVLSWLVGWLVVCTFMSRAHTHLEPLDRFAQFSGSNDTASCREVPFGCLNYEI